MWVQVHKCACVCGRQLYVKCLLPYFSYRGSNCTWSSLICLDWLGSNLLRSSYVHLPSTRITGLNFHVQLFYVGAEDSNSGSQTCTANTSCTKPTPSPSRWILSINEHSLKVTRAEDLKNPDILLTSRCL